MMPETVRELAAGRSVAVAQLFEFEFRSSTQRFWDGLNYLTAGSRQWQGAGKLISATGLEYASDMSASPATFTLSGATPELIAFAIASEFEVKERPCAVYIQFLSSRFAALDNPIAIWSGKMDQLSFKGDVKNQSLSLSAETLFVGRARSQNGLQTDRDQQARWPGDLGMSIMPKLKNKTVNWLRS